MLAEVSGEQVEEVHPRPGPFVDAVRPIRIRHHGERLVGGDEGVCELLGSLVVHVVIAGSMNEHSREGDGCRSATPDASLGTKLSAKRHQHQE